MEISLERIAEVEDPYRSFVDSIKNKETLRKYDRRLDYFLKLVPSSLYLEHLGKLSLTKDTHLGRRLTISIQKKYPNIQIEMLQDFLLMRESYVTEER